MKTPPCSPVLSSDLTAVPAAASQNINTSLLQTPQVEYSFDALLTRSRLLTDVDLDSSAHGSADEFTIEDDIDYENHLAYSSDQGIDSDSDCLLASPLCSKGHSRYSGSASTSATLLYGLSDDEVDAPIGPKDIIGLNYDSDSLVDTDTESKLVTALVVSDDDVHPMMGCEMSSDGPDLLFDSDLPSLTASTGTPLSSQGLLSECSLQPRPIDIQNAAPYQHDDMLLDEFRTVEHEICLDMDMESDAEPSFMNHHMKVDPYCAPRPSSVFFYDPKVGWDSADEDLNLR